jgi:hypothetical protein
MLRAYLKALVIVFHPDTVVAKNGSYPAAKATDRQPGCAFVPVILSPI